MGHPGAELGHAVAVLHMFAGEVVQSVEVLFVAGNGHVALGFVDRDDGLEEHALAFLDILSHGVQVRRKDDGSGEDAFAVLAFAFAEELFQPLAEVLEFRIEAGEKFDLLAAVVQEVAHGGVADGRVLGAGFRQGFLGVLGAADHGFNVKAGQGDGDEAHRCQHGEAAADVVFDDEGLVAFLVREALEGAAGLVGDGHDAFAGFVLAVGTLQVVLDQAEGHGGLGGGAALGNHHAGGIAEFDQVEEFGRIVFREVFAREDHFEAVAAQVAGKAVAQGFDGGLGAEVGAADADHDHEVDLALEPAVHDAQAVVQFGLADRLRQMLPAQEIIAGPAFFLQDLLGGQCTLQIFVVLFLRDK